MKTFLDFLRHPDVKLAGYLLVFALFVWFLGPYIAFAGYSPLLETFNRIVVIAVVLLIVFFVKLLKFMFAIRARQQLIDGMSEEHDINRMIDAEAAELQKKFQYAFSHLKSKNGKSSLLQLPWFMIIGQPGSGKTTLFANSGLKFPLAEFFQNRAIQGVGGTKNCDWWIAQDAVLLDTAGRYTSRDSHAQVDDAGWNKFLSLIAKYRRKPVNGLLISISIADLLSQSETEFRAQIQVIKRRITELNNRFDTRFPLYVFLTKTDLLSGFSQFFEDLTQQEREQVLGATFQLDSASNDKVADEFSQKFTQLLRSLERRQWSRLDAERDPGRKAQIFGFVRQLATLGDNLREIVATLAAEDAGHVPGIVRGVYFTSGTQSGSPVDRLLDKISQTFGVKNKSQLSWNNSGRSYFVRELLQKVVFAEAGASGVFDRYERRRRLVFRSLLGVFGVSCLCLLVAWTYIFKQNQTVITQASMVVQRWDDKTLSEYKNRDLKTLLPLLNDFRQQYIQLEALNTLPFGLGLSQTSDLLLRFEQHYQQALNAALVPALQQALMTKLDNSDDAQSYNYLKTYLMLALPQRREQQFLSVFFNENAVLAAGLNDVEQVQMNEHMQSLLKSDFAVVPVDDVLVAKARRAILASSLQNFYYQQFKKRQLDPVATQITLDQLAGVDWRSLFAATDESGPTISSIYMPEFYTRLKDELLPDFLKAVENETWVLGVENTFNSQQSELQLLTFYARDYQTAWQQLLNSLQVIQSVGKNDVMRQLDVAGAYNSPLIQLVDSVVASTTLNTLSDTEQQARQLAEKNAKAKLVANRLSTADATATLIAGPFTRLHLLGQPEIKANWQKQLTTQLQDLAFNLAQPLNEENSQLIKGSVRSLKAFAFAQPQPLKNWLNQLVENSIQVTDAIAANELAALAQESKNQLRLAWQQEIGPVCQSVLGLYPFTETADTEANLQQISDLFANEGVLQQFFTTNVLPLLASPNRPFRFKPEIQAQYQLADEVLKFYEQVYQIRQLLFPKGSTQPFLSYGFTPLILDSKAAKFRLNVQGQEMVYQFGKASTTSVQWPGLQPELPVEFAFVRADGSELAESFNGLFALYRLFDQSDLQLKNAKTVEITFMKDSYQAKYQITGQGVSSALLFRDLRSFRCPAAI